jgi:hypothetical protein
VGLELHPESAGILFAEMNCEGEFVGVRGRKSPGHGCVISPLTFINEMENRQGLRFLGGVNEGSAFQTPEFFQGSSHRCILEVTVNGGASWEAAAATLKGAIFMEAAEALELKA